MLVLTRKSDESVMVGNAIEIKVLAIKGDQVSLGFQAPKEISIHRKEVYVAIQQENKAAVGKGGHDVKKFLASFGEQLMKQAHHKQRGE